MAANKKIVIASVIGIVVLELLSWLAHSNPEINAVSFWLVAAIIAILALIRLEYGVLALLIELFIGSQGRLLVFEGLTIRMVIFLIVFGAWAIQRIRRKNFQLFKGSLYPYLILFLFIALGLFQGVLNNQNNNVFFDFNAWAFFALLFVFIDVAKTKTFLTNFLTVLIAATSWLTIKTILTLVFFSQAIAEIGGPFYNWIRDTRVGEVTYISGNLFRVFFQSHLYILIGGLLVLTLALINWHKWKPTTRISAAIYIYFTSLVIIISQSRSFWLGAIVALVSLFVLAKIKFNLKYKPLAITAALIILMIVDQIYVVQFLTGSFGNNLAGQRFIGLQSEAAGISRLNQLEPLGFNIGQRLVLGYGFGKTLTYISTDPRIVAANPGGVYTTYAFEWGYLDMMLKIGSLGLLIYLFILFQLYKIGLQKNPLTLGLLVGLTALVVTNIFSPYLNHPLGIGYILLITGLLLQLRPDKLTATA